MSSVPTYVAPHSVAPGAPAAVAVGDRPAPQPVAHPQRCGSQERDIVRTVGLAAVFVSAAVLSFDTLNRLASAVGWTGTWHVASGVELRLSWLLPIAIDCHAWLTVREWLRGTAGARRTRYAARSARVALGLTMAANALFHAFDALHWSLSDSPVAAIVVGAIPPFLAERVAVMFTLGRAGAQAKASPAAADPAASTVLPPVERDTITGALPASATPYSSVARTQQPAVSQPARNARTGTGSPATARRRSDLPANVDAVALVVPLVADAAPGAPSQRRVRAHLKQHGISIGFPKAKQLIQEASLRTAAGTVAS